MRHSASTCQLIFLLFSQKWNLYILDHIDGLVQGSSSLIANAIQLLRPCTYPSNVDGLVQDNSNFTANALELLQSCTKPSAWQLLIETSIYLLLTHTYRHSLPSPRSHWHQTDVSRPEYCETTDGNRRNICYTLENSEKHWRWNNSVKSNPALWPEISTLIGVEFALLQYLYSFNHLAVSPHKFKHQQHRSQISALCSHNCYAWNNSSYILPKSLCGCTCHVNW